MVLYSRSHEYDEMYKITREYYKRFDNVVTLYYLFSGKNEEPYIEEDILYLPGNESFLPGILDKTMMTFSCVCKILPNYDYYIRTNISTIVDINQFLKHVEIEPIEFGGHIMHIRNGYRDPACGINNDRFSGLDYVAGTLIIFSNETFKRIINHSDQIDRTVIDDVAIGQLAKKLEIVPSDIKIEINKHSILTSSIIYRNKSDNRNHDVKRMREIVKYI